MNVELNNNYMQFVRKLLKSELKQKNNTLLLSLKVTLRYSVGITKFFYDSFLLVNCNEEYFLYPTMALPLLCLFRRTAQEMYLISLFAQRLTQLSLLYSKSCLFNKWYDLNIIRAQGENFCLRFCLLYFSTSYRDHTFHSLIYTEPRRSSLSEKWGQLLTRH